MSSADSVESIPKILISVPYGKLKKRNTTNFSPAATVVLTGVVDDAGGRFGLAAKYLAGLDVARAAVLAATPAL